MQQLDTKKILDEVDKICHSTCPAYLNDLFEKGAKYV